MGESQSIDLVNLQKPAELLATGQSQIQNLETGTIPAYPPKTPEGPVDSKETEEADRKTLTQQVPAEETQANATQAKSKVRQLAEKIIGESRTTQIINYIGESHLVNFSQGLKKAALGSLATALVLFGACWMVGGTITGALAIGAVVGTISLIGAAVAYAKFAQLILKCKDLEKTVESCQSNCEKIKEQNESIKNELSGANATLKNQEKTIQSLEANNNELTKKCDEAKTTANNLVEECKHQIAEKNQTIAEQKKTIQEKAQELEEAQKEIITLMSENTQLKEQVDTYCNAFKGLVVSQEQAIENLRQQFEKQVETTNAILRNVNDIANGEQELTDALKWAQEQIAKGQRLLSDIATLSVDMTDSAKISQMITDGSLINKAKQIQAKTQEATQILSELSTGLSERIISAQTKISQSREAAKEKVKLLQKEIDKAKATIQEQARELDQKKLEIAEKEKEIAKEKERFQGLHSKAKETVGQAKEIFAEKDKTIAAQNTKNEELNEELRKIDAEKSKLDGQLTEMENRLKEQSRLLAELTNSHEQLVEAHAKITETNKTQAETIQQQQELQQQLYKQATDLKKQLEDAQQSTGGWFGLRSVPAWLTTAIGVAGTLVIASNPAALAAGGAALAGAAIGTKGGK